jgi:hypothetical protein
VGPFAGVSVFGLDALSSDGYGPEAALTILIPLGVVALLILILLGVAYLVAAYGITATEPGSSNYRSILSLLAAAVVGQGPFYYIALGSILLVLSLSANTSFADFPRVCRFIAEDGFLP